MKVYSIFRSIDGEVSIHSQGAITTFVRLAGCNLRCSWCDTKYALKSNSGESFSVKEILDEVSSLGTKNVTITGGEPLTQTNEMIYLLSALTSNGFCVSVETNGTMPILSGKAHGWVVDYKLPSSQTEYKPERLAFLPLRRTDFVKFVVQNRIDFSFALRAMDEIRSWGSVAKFAFSPVSQHLRIKELMGWILESKIEAVLNVQLHKVLALEEEK